MGPKAETCVCSVIASTGGVGLPEPGICESAGRSFRLPFGIGVCCCA